MSVDQGLLEIIEHTEEGYHPCVDYGEWRVAILRYIDELEPKNIDAMECHNETDEVFVLLNGQCILFIGDGDGAIEMIYPVDMLPKKVYNVKRGVYHTHTLSNDAILLIVENRNTGPINSDRLRLTENQREQLVAMARMLWKKDE
jgi:hypothetical protein